MQQLIRFKGLSLTPDEMAVENGALSLCGNLELHDGALRPSILTGTTLSNKLCLSDGTVTTLLYIHESSSYKHFITKSVSEDDHSLHWFDKEGKYGGVIRQFDKDVIIKDINSVGNTLIIIASDGMHHSLWNKNAYEYLGTYPPFINLSFGLSKNYSESYETGGADVEGSSAGFDVAFQVFTATAADTFNKLDSSSYKPGDTIAEVKTDKQSDVTQSVWALINRTNNLIAKNGKFYANFMVRYCYRLYDGSTILYSAPVFMPVSFPGNYNVFSMNFESFRGKKYNIKSHKHEYIEDVNWFNLDAYNRITDISTININNDKIAYNRKDKDGNVHTIKTGNATFMYVPRNVALTYKYISSPTGSYAQLNKWKNVVKAIDIYVTPPITKVDTSQKITSVITKQQNYSLKAFLANSFWSRDYSWDGAPGKYERTEGKMFCGIAMVNVPSTDDETYCKKIADTSTFYKIASLDLENPDDFPLVETELKIDKSVLENLALQQQMKDDYKSHNEIYPDGVFVYNHRVNAYNIREKLFNGFDSSMFPIGNYFFPFYGLGNNDTISVRKIVTVIETTEGRKIVECIKNFNMDLLGLANTSKFYPDSRATQMVFFGYVDDYTSSSTMRMFSFKLTECSELNGAMQLSFFTEDYKQYEISSFEYTKDDIVEQASKIYTSEADNPYSFPVNGINTVGIGTIQGIATTTRALSQGQFGQFPLIAFSTDGIWALDVSSTGTYSGIHPISREVCSNNNSITQLDQSVIFATNRSLSKVVESQVVSMSDMLDGPSLSIQNTLSKLYDFFAEEKECTEEELKTRERVLQLMDFAEYPIDFFQRCQVIYDYKNSRIFCLDINTKGKSSDADTVALCYSIRDGAWNTFLIQNVLTAINSYPHPYIQFRDGSVTCLDKGYDLSDNSIHDGIIVTRTLKFDEDECPNAITGYIHSQTASTAPILWLFGSNDNQNWHYIGRVGGYKSNYMATKSYRYFRIGIFMRMLAKSQYMATRLNFVRKFGKI